MKINKKEFDALTREPDMIQDFDDKKISIFFMTPDEQEVYSISERYAIWTSDGKEYRLLVNKDYYDYGDIKEFYAAEVNKRWLGYIERMTKLQRRTLFTVMLPVMAVYIAIAIVTLIFLQDYAIYILIGLIVVIFGVNYFQNKMVRGNMEKENDATQLEIQEILGEDLYDKIAQDQIEYRQKNAPVPLDDTFVEEAETVEADEVEEGEDLDEEK